VGAAIVLLGDMPRTLHRDGANRRDGSNGQDVPEICFGNFLPLNRQLQFIQALTDYDPIPVSSCSRARHAILEHHGVTWPHHD
jgi:hypothetical protein